MRNRCTSLVRALVLFLRTDAAHGCSLCAARQVGDGPVFELTADSIDGAAARHDLLLLLLFSGEDKPTAGAQKALGVTAGRLEKALKDPYLDPELISPEARKFASMSNAVDGDRHSLMVAQVPAMYMHMHGSLKATATLAFALPYVS